MRIEPSLDRAERESLDLVAVQLVPLDLFFTDVKTRTPEFAEEVLGFGSKWRFVIDKLPFTKGGRHAAYLRQAFSDHLFESSELSQAIEQVANGYADALAGIENEMLVRIRKDIADLPASRLPPFADQTALRAAYDKALESVVGRVSSDIEVDVATLVASLVAEEVLTQVAIRLGVSAGVLSAGAATSWASLGIGLVVGLVVDRLVTWTWDWLGDPKGHLATEMNGQLDRLHDLMVEGDGTFAGLKVRLADFARQRAAIRRQAIVSLLD